MVGWGRGSRRWGVGWVMRGLGAVVVEGASEAARAARKSGSAPNSSSSSMMGVSVVDEVEVEGCRM